MTLQTLHTRIARERQQAALLEQRMRQCLRVTTERRRDRYDLISLRLETARAAYASARRAQIARARERVLTCEARARLAINALLDHRTARLERAERLLSAVSYRGVLARGFALVRDSDGRPLRTAAAIRPGLRLDIEFADGRVRATAETTTSEPAAPPVRRRRRSGGEGQGSLF